MISGSTLVEVYMQTRSARAFCDNLNTLLKVRGITKAELARRLEVSPTAVVQWSKGQRQPNFEWLDSIADALGVTPADLISENAHHANERITLQQALAVVNDHLGYLPPKKTK